MLVCRRALLLSATSKSCADRFTQGKLRLMAKIIDPDNYVPHNLPIPRPDKAKPIDWTKYPAGLLTAEEVREFDQMLNEMRDESKTSPREPCK